MRSFLAPSPPAIIEAEQGVLGAILANNRYFEGVADTLRSEHFADPILARIYADAERRIRSGQVADAVTLRGAYEADGTLHEVGGPSYLAQLISAMASPLSLPSYADAIVDRWRRRQIMNHAHEAIARAQQVADEDPAASIASSVANDMLALAESGAQDRSTDIGSAAAAALQAAEEASRNGGRPPGVSTGLPSLDRLIGGFSPSQMIVLGARPGVGKTALALTFALGAARSGIGVLIISLEMPAPELAERLLAHIAGIPGNLIRDGQLRQEQWDALVGAQHALAQLDIRIFASSAVKVGDRASRSLSRPPLQMPQGCTPAAAWIISFLHEAAFAFPAGNALRDQLLGFVAAAAAIDATFDSTPIAKLKAHGRSKIARPRSPSSSPRSRRKQKR